ARSGCGFGRSPGAGCTAWSSPACGSMSALPTQSARPRRRWPVAEAARPKVYSIAAHRGFADALVAGLVPRYAEPELGLARLTLLLPSRRAVRTVTEAFIRHSGQGPSTSSGQGLLMPRMAVDRKST